MKLQPIIDNGGPQPIINALKFLNQSQYTTVGDFLKSLSDSDLAFLMDYIKQVQNGDLGIALKWVCCLADAVALAEGLPIDEPEIYRVQHLMVVLTFENLFRSGTIDFIRNLASLGQSTDFEKMASIKK